jgi:hypothetical protein
MTLREPPQDLEVLASIDGASGRERSDDGSRTHVTVFATGSPRQDGRSLFEVVRQLSMERRWALDGLYVEHGRLDEVFRTLTQGAARREVAA